MKIGISLNPFLNLDLKKFKSYQREPYVLCGDIFTASGLRGHGGWSWYTGAAGWYLKLKKEMKENTQLKLMRILIAVFIAISAVIAIFQYQSGSAFIAQMMGISWGALAGAFLAPFLYGLYWKRTTKIACMVSFFFSTVVMILNVTAKSIFPAFLQSPINAGAFCMLAGMIIVPLISLITPAPDRNKIEKIFSCYDRTVVVHAKDSIGSGEEQPS